jgi:glucose-6-phosphate 1-dehydrogenase
MAVTQTAQACDLVIFGAKGDLARRKLLPSLYQLEKAGQIHLTPVSSASAAPTGIKRLHQSRARSAGNLHEGKN